MDERRSRRGRPRTRFYATSNPIERVKSGDEIRQYERRRGEASVDDPKQNLLKALSRIVAEDGDAQVNFSGKRKIPSLDGLTIDSSISDSAKLKLLRSNAMEDREGDKRESGPLVVCIDDDDETSPTRFTKPVNLPTQTTANKSYKTRRSLDETILKPAKPRFRPILPALQDGVSGPATIRIRSSTEMHVEPQLPKPSTSNCEKRRALAVESAPESQWNGIKCFFCRFECYDRMEFFLHMQEHVVSSKFKCSRCEESFDDDESFKLHIMREHCVCKICGYVELSAGGIKTHVTYHHKNEVRSCQICGGNLNPVDLPVPNDFMANDKNDLQCNKCGALTTYQQFYEHVLNYKSKTSKSLKWECFNCPYESKDEDAFIRHRTHHNKALWKIHKCQLCEFVSEDQEIVKAHTLHHLRGTIAKCEDCRFYTIGESRMALHKVVHTGSKPFQCSYCSFMTVNPKIISYHLKNHLKDIETQKFGEVQVKCGQCDYRGTWTEMDVHVSSHVKSSNHACILCGKEFQSKLGYKRHMQQHTGEYPYPCPECNKGFFDEHNLKDHIFSHRGIKPYECTCGQRYQRRKNLAHHQKQCTKYIESTFKPVGGRSCNSQKDQNAQMPLEMWQKEAKRDMPETE